MWSKLDDAFITHPKICAAAELLGGRKRDGGAKATALYVNGLVWTNQHGTDGHLPTSTVQNFWHLAKPLQVAEVLVTVGLWEKANGGFVIHDFHDHNYTGEERRRRARALHQIRAAAGRNGGLKSANVRQKARRPRRKVREKAKET